MHSLVVTHEFGAYRVGQEITEPGEVAFILAGSNHAKVVKVPVIERTAETEASETVQEPQDEAGATEEAGERPELRFGRSRQS